MTGPGVKRIAVITGAARGIGAATAVALARRGIVPVLAVRDSDKARDVVEAIATLGHECHVESCDISNATQVQRLVDNVLRAYGRIDIVVNNAGQIAPIGMISDTRPDEWAAAIGTNLIGPYLLLRAALPALQASRGTVVNLSSGAAHAPRDGWSAYCSAKAGLAMLTRCIDSEYREHGIAAFSIQPGMVDTGMQAEIRRSGMNEVSRIPREKLALPETAASIVAWLADRRPVDLIGHELDARDARLLERIQDGVAS